MKFDYRIYISSEATPFLSVPSVFPSVCLSISNDRVVWFSLLALQLVYEKKEITSNTLMSAGRDTARQ